MTDAREMNGNPERQKKRRKLLWQFVYIFGTLLLMLLLGLLDPDLMKLFSGQLALDGRWLIYSGVAMAGFWSLQACVYALIGRMVEEHVSFWTSVRITMFGEYYSAVTPFASGGQPMLIAYYRRYGVGAAKASSILAVRYIGYVSSVVICYIVALLVEGAQVFREFPVIFWLTVGGFLINFASIVMVVLLMVNPSLVRRTGLWVIRLIARIPLFKNKREKWETSYLKGVEEFAAAVEYIRQRPFQCALVLLLSLGSVVCEFSVAYLVYRALGLTAAGFLELFSMQTFLYLAVSFAPTPGGSGATEGGFYLFFAMVFPKQMLFSAMLVWRLFTYYSQLMLGAGFVVVDEFRSIRRQRKQQDALQPDMGATGDGQTPETTEENAPQNTAQADDEASTKDDREQVVPAIQETYAAASESSTDESRETNLR